MHFTSTALVAALALCGSVFAAPVQVTERELVQLDRRLVTGQYYFYNDLATVPIPPYAPGDKKGQKLAAKAQYTNADRIPKQQSAAHAVGTLLNAAQAHLHLPQVMQVRVINNWHSSRDPVRHITFRFIHPACGQPNNECTGHAYNYPDGHGVGKIFPDVAHGGENAPPIFAA